MIDRVRERKEHHKRRGKLYRITVAIVGFAVIILGLLLSLPGVPGPGLLLIAVGLGLLALEFDRAERLLEKVLDRLEQVSEQASKAPRWVQVVGAALALAGLAAAVAAVVLWEIPYFPG
jgi:uncharacterized protein (TIGR02611 family)